MRNERRAGSGLAGLTTSTLTRRPMTDPRDYKVEVSGVTPPEPPAAPRAARPYLSVRFDCCGAYQRVYRDPGDPCYRGRCPRCAREVVFPVGQGGTSSRFFVVR
jgi:hypothetical protein